MFIQGLKVKIKSLIEEDRIIAKEELVANRRIDYYGPKLKDANISNPDPVYLKFWEAVVCFRELRTHREVIVKKETRWALLAYGFLRGRPYVSMEPRVRLGNEPNWIRVYTLAKKFGGKDFNEQEFLKWRP